jgi:hypothetical protein
MIRAVAGVVHEGMRPSEAHALFEELARETVPV